MDAVDLAILDEITSTRAVLFGGIDPRQSPESIASRLGLNPSTIRSRMKHWRDIGFLVRWHIMPNPDVIAMQHYTGYLVAPEIQERRRIKEAIALTDGMIVCFEHVGGLIGMGAYAASKDHADRRFQLIANLPGAKVVSPMGHVATPKTDIEWNAKDWQLFHCLRAQPEASVQDLALATKTSRNTTARRLQRLTEAGTIWNVAELDFRKFDGVLVRLILDVTDGTARDAFDALCAEFDACFFRDVSTSTQVRCHAMVRLDSAAQQDDLAEAMLGQPNISGSQIIMPRRFRPLPETLDAVLPIATNVPN